MAIQWQAPLEMIDGLGGGYYINETVSTLEWQSFGSVFVNEQTAAAGTAVPVFMHHYMQQGAA